MKSKLVFHRKATYHQKGCAKKLKTLVQLQVAHVGMANFNQKYGVHSPYHRSKWRDNSRWQERGKRQRETNQRR